MASASTRLSRWVCCFRFHFRYVAPRFDTCYLIVACAAQSTNVQCAGNSCYQYVYSSGITWTAAYQASLSATYNGRTGHLVTIESANEQNELQRLFSTSYGVYIWIGANSVQGPN